MFKEASAHTNNARTPATLFQKEQGDSTFIQPKLNIGKPGDKYEVEADRVADTIVARENGQATSLFSQSPAIQKQTEEEVQKQENNEPEIQQKPLVESITPLIQRQPEEEQIQEKQGEHDIHKQEAEHQIQKKSESCPVTPDIQKQEEEIQQQPEEVQKKPETDQEIHEKEEIVQHKTNTNTDSSSTEPLSNQSLESKLSSSGGSGKKLPEHAKNEMESGFGTDFSNVNIHTDNTAVNMSKELGAQAFTHGNDIYFNEGKYNPDTQDGKHLLAHELTHTVQQQGGKNTINKYPHHNCEDGEVIDRAQTVVWFEQDSTRFRSDSEVDSTVHFLLLLQEIRSYLDMVGSDGIVFIHGYASEEGGAGHNLTLSMQRAIRIKTLLVASGIPDSQLMPIGHGENSEYENRAYNRRAEVTYFPTATCMEFDPLPITGSITVMDCSDGRNINNNGDHDLDKLIHRPDDRSPDIWIYDNLLGETGAYSDFYIGFFAGTFGVDTSDDNLLFENFTTGSGGQIHYSTGSDMAREIGGTDAFTAFADEFEESVRAYFNTHHTLNGFDCQAELIRTRPNYVGGTDSLFSWAVMGGYQRLEAHIDLSGGQINITYRVFDHYGAGVSDAWSYLPGLSAMYYLQHYVTGSSSTYVPFIWSVHINRINAL